MSILIQTRRKFMLSSASIAASFFRGISPSQAMNTNSPSTMKTVYHPSQSRGAADHGWLNARHSFSFADYHDPERMGFGVLRVLNDDIIAAGRGFGTHPHRDMEILTIPLEGDLKHNDSMGKEEVIRHGDVQVMSAGTGITHSEFNANKDREVKLLQIWIKPRERGVKPRYDQISLKERNIPNQLQQILSPNPNDEGVWIHQDAWFHLGEFTQSTELLYNYKKSGNGLYVFVIDGEITVADHALNARDGLGVSDITQLKLKANAGARVLLMEVPMA